MRRSRGYAPFPVKLPFSLPTTLAVGGELKATFCLIRDDHAFMSQHIGDMENLEHSTHSSRRLSTSSPSFVPGRADRQRPPPALPFQPLGSGTRRWLAARACATPPRPHRRGHGRARPGWPFTCDRLQLRRHRLRQRRRDLGRRGALSRLPGLPAAWRTWRIFPCLGAMPRSSAPTVLPSPTYGRRACRGHQVCRRWMPARRPNAVFSFASSRQVSIPCRPAAWADCSTRSLRWQGSVKRSLTRHRRRLRWKHLRKCRVSGVRCQEVLELRITLAKHPGRMECQ